MDNQLTKEQPPTFKADCIYNSSAHKAFPAFRSWLKYIIERALEEGNKTLPEEEIEKLVNEQCFLKEFKVSDIVFRIKIE